MLATLSGRAGGSGRLDLPFRPASVRVRIHFPAVGAFAARKRGMRDRQHGTYEFVEGRSRRRSFVAFWQRRCGLQHGNIVAWF